MLFWPPGQYAHHESRIPGTSRESRQEEQEWVARLSRLGEQNQASRFECVVYGVFGTFYSRQDLVVGHVNRLGMT